MRIGLQIPSFKWPGGPAKIGSRLADIATVAEDAGMSSIWVMDHFFQIPAIGPSEDPMLESYSTLSYLAAITNRVRLGTMVTGIVYRRPGILIKTVSTLDVLSGGRANLGIGAAWFERESIALGVPFPPVSERLERLEETLQIAKQMWSGQGAEFEGKHYQLAETLNSPMPISKPHPPIMIGGMGEKKTLRLVAQYADACNFFGRAGAEETREKFSRALELLRGHCEEVGRPYDEIERTALIEHLVLMTDKRASDGMSASEVIDACGSLAEIGIQHVIFNMPAHSHEIAPLEVFGKEIIPAVAEF